MASNLASATRGSVQRGVVDQFDEPRGLGTVTVSSELAFPFHCTAIADGSRDIPVPTTVDFVVCFGRLGRLEARAITPAS